MKCKFLFLIFSSMPVCFTALLGCSSKKEFSQGEKLSYSFHPASSPVVGVSINAKNEVSFADREGRFFDCKSNEGCKIKFKRSADLIDYSVTGKRRLVLERDDNVSPISLISLDEKGETVYVLSSRPSEEVYGFDAYKDKKIAVVRGENMCVDVIDFENGKLIYKFCIDQGKRFGVIGSVKFNAQGDKLAVAPFRSECHIWSMQEKKVTVRMELPNDGTQAATRSVSEMVFSPDSERIFVATESTIYKFAITSFSVKDGKFHAHTTGVQGIYQMKMSPDGKSIAAIEGGWKTRILLIDADTLKIKQVIAQEEVEEYYFSCLSFSPDGKRLVIGDSAGEIRVYEIGSK